MEAAQTFVELSERFFKVEKRDDLGARACVYVNKKGMRTVERHAKTEPSAFFEGNITIQGCGIEMRKQRGEAQGPKGIADTQTQEIFLSTPLHNHGLFVGKDERVPSVHALHLGIRGKNCVENEFVRDFDSLPSVLGRPNIFERRRGRTQNRFVKAREREGFFLQIRHPLFQGRCDLGRKSTVCTQPVVRHGHSVRERAREPTEQGGKFILVGFAIAQRQKMSRVCC